MLSRHLADREEFGGADFGLVETLLPYGVTLRRRRIRDDLADPQVIVLKDLGPTLLLCLVVHGERAPADHGLLVAPGRQGQNPAFVAPARVALVVDEAVDFLDVRFE